MPAITIGGTELVASMLPEMAGAAGGTTDLMSLLGPMGAGAGGKAGSSALGSAGGPLMTNSLMDILGSGSGTSTGIGSGLSMLNPSTGADLLPDAAADPTFMGNFQKQMQSNPMMAMMLGKSLIGNPGMKPGTPPPNMPQARPQGSGQPWGNMTQMPSPIAPATIGGGDSGGMSQMLRMLQMLQGR